MSPSSRFGRRDVLRILGVLGFGAAAGCAPEMTPRDGRYSDLPTNPIDTIGPTDADASAEANLRALLDTLLPAERAEDGTVLRPGANEVEAFEMMRLSRFAPAAEALGLIPTLPAELRLALEGFDPAVRALIDADLDALAAMERPFTRFTHLDEASRRRAVARGFDDPARAPLLTFVRAAALLAYLGAVRSDVGLVALGFPPFEDPRDGLAVSGYPRTTDGRLVDADTEDLDALAAIGVLDDYTFDLAPPPADLSAILDANGDLY